MRAAAAFLAVLPLVASCARAAALPPEPPPTAATPSALPRAEIAIGRILVELTTAMRGTYPDPKLAAYVQSVGERVAKASDRPGVAWEFHVVDDDEVSAHAMPGGQVVVSRGTLAWLGSEAELAAVLAHEIAHGAHRHPRLRDGDVPDAADPGFEERSRRLDADEERQADALAVEYLARAGYDPHAVASALDAVLRGAAVDCRDCSRADDDPHPERRARLVRVAVAAGSRRGERGVERYLHHVDGLVLGPSPRRPRLVGDRYVAPGQLSFELPRARLPELSGTLATTQRGAPRLSIATFGGAFWRDSLRSAIEKDRHEWRRSLGRRALVGRLGGEGPPVSVAVVEGPVDCFLLGAEGDGPDARAALERLLASAAPAPPVGPPARQLRVVAARRAGAFESTARRSCGSEELASLTALNGTEPGARVPAGGLLKCVSER